MEITTRRIYTSKVGHTHHNLATIADVIVSAREQYILHKSITVIIFDDDGKTIKHIMKFNTQNTGPGLYERNFIKSGCKLSSWIRSNIETHYVSGNVFHVEVDPEEVD